jgi:hypothetical protein
MFATIFLARLLQAETPVLLVSYIVLMLFVVLAAPSFNSTTSSV